MKLLIAGSRTLHPDYYFIRSCIEHFEPYDDRVTEIVSGGAKGVDTSARIFVETDLKVMDYPFSDSALTFTEFLADWDKHGRSAGHIRNKQMAEYSDILLLVWDGKSRGSKNMKENMEKLGKPVFEIIVKGPKK